MMWRFQAESTAAARSRQFNLSKMLLTWVFTVFSLTKSCVAISEVFRSDLDDVALPGRKHRSGAVAAVQLVKDVADVGLHRVLADKELRRDLRVVLAIGHQTQYVALARGKSRVIYPRGMHQCRIEQGFTCGHLANRAG